MATSSLQREKMYTVLKHRSGRMVSPLQSLLNKNILFYIWLPMAAGNPLTLRTGKIKSNSYIHTNIQEGLCSYLNFKENENIAINVVFPKHSGFPIRILSVLRVRWNNLSPKVRDILGFVSSFS